MALETPMGSTQIAARDYKNPLLELFGKAFASGQNLAGQGVNEEAGAKLKALLQGQQTEKDLEAATEAADANGGRSVRVGDASVGVDPMAGLAKQGRKDSIHAVEGLQRTYNTGAKDLNKIVGAIQGGLNALKSNDASSLGQLRAAMLNASGLNRFNEAEALANAPDSVKSEVAALFNKYGLDTQDGNLTDIQRNNAQKFFKGKLDELQSRHKTIREEALSQYSQNPGSDLSRLAGLQSTLGAPLETELGGLGKSLAELQATQAANPEPKGPQGLFSVAGDALRSFLGGNTAVAAPKAPMTPPAAAALNAPSSFDPDAFLKGR